MISYLAYTTICLGLVLLFYHIVLAKEKMYQINRWYLLLGLTFSLLVPFLPIGMTDSSMNLGSDGEPSVVSALQGTAGAIDDVIGKNPLTMEWVFSVLFYLYSVVTSLLIIRMGWQLYQMRKKAMKKTATFFEGYKIVLLNEEVVPHTFGKTIYVNKQQFDRGDISKEMLLHEFTHAKENHSLDILFIEILKAIYWFNPMLYFYKGAMQMNHEFIADNSVLSKDTDIAKYQSILLSLSKRKPACNLGTSLNYNVTKKRFKMMTSHTSTYRSIFKTVLIISLFTILGFTFGCELSSMEKTTPSQKVHVEILGNETIKIDGKTIPVSQFASTFSSLSVDPNNIIDVKVHNGASMGSVADVQTILRKQGALKINYSSDKSET